MTVAAKCSKCGGELGDEASPAGTCKWCSADAEMTSTAAQASSATRQVYSSSNYEPMYESADNSRAVWAIVQVVAVLGLLSIKFCA